MMAMKTTDLDVKLHVGLAKNGATEDHVLYHRLSGAVSSAAPAAINAYLNDELKHVSLEKLFQVYNLVAKYSYEDVTTLQKFVYGDTFIQATLPYCLHLRSGTAFEVHVPEDGYSALVTLQKIWTKRAAGSSEADFVHDTQTTYFTGGTMQTPQFPVDPTFGWELNYTGVNVEKIKDSNGMFRYTDVLIELNTGITANQLEQDQAEKDLILGQLTAKALEVVKRLLDTYRYVTRECHAERVGRLNIHNIYFNKQNVGFYVMSMLGTGISTAIMNLPQVMSVEIGRMLKASEQPPLAELLQLDAEASLDGLAYTLAVVKSFQALEIFVEGYVLERYRAAGLSGADALRILEIKWRTPERLKHLLKDVSGQSAAQAAWWHEWIKLYDSVRNEVLHQAKDPSEAEAGRVVELNREMMAWIKELPLVNTGLPQR